MIEMIHGETLIKVVPDKVPEMLQKGWQIKKETGYSEPEFKQEDSSEEE